jgi:hypothetical protein
LDVRADGQQQVLRITKYEPQLSLYKPRRLSTLPDRKGSMASSAEAFEAVTEEVTQTLAFNVDFAGIGISLVNRKMVEVIYMTIDNLKFEYTDSNVAQAINISCGSLQIDNQLHDAIYPVILQPTPIVKESNGVAALPTVQGSIIWLKDQGKARLLCCVPAYVDPTIRTWCLLHKILFNLTSSFDYRDRRRPPLCHLRSDTDQRSFVGGWIGRVGVWFFSR